MSADDIHDLEEEIPKTKIVNFETDDNNIINDNSYAESNNFIEFLLDEDLDDGDIEYIEYSDIDDHNSNTEDNKIEEQIKDEPKDEQDVNEEEIFPDVDVKKEDCKDELYHCSSCNINFSSVMDHIKSFHKNQSVIVDGGFEESKDNTNEEQKGDIKTEVDEEEFYSLSNFTNSDDVDEFSYIDENSSSGLTNMQVQTINEAKNDSSEVEKLYDNQCPACQITFSSLEELNQHTCEEQLQSEVTNDLKPRFACTLCSSAYQNQRSLASHMRVHKNPKKDKFVKTLPSDETNTRCEICNTTFPTMKSLKLHRRMHGPIKTKPFEDTIGYDLKAISKDRSSGETFFCELCNKSYDVMFQDIHIKSHKPGQKFICHGCNKKFSNKISLNMHMKVHQEYGTSKKQVKVKEGMTLPYECGFCGKQFTRPHEKVKHERIHTGEKPFKCEICGKCFRVSYCLTLHLRTHTGARPYVCAHCNKRFKSYSVYNHHLMTHSDERPYKCPFCPKTFKTSVQLGGHKNSHTKPFSCPECNRPFASLYSVKAHMETHVKGSRNLKHRCIVCGAIYARIFALRDHMKEQHQSVLNEDGEVSVNDIIIKNEDIISAQSIMPDNEEEITVGEIEQFQTEEVVTDWLK